MNLKNKPKEKYTEVLAIDPGGTTGFCRLIINYETKTILITEIDEFQTWARFDEFIEYARTRPHVCIVYESFQLQLLSAVLIPVEVIGILRYLCLKHKIPHFSQCPHERLTTEKWFPNNMSHFLSHDSGSAIRHGIYFAVKELFENKLPKLAYNLAELKRK